MQQRDKMEKIAGYIRVSTKKQKEEKSHIRQKEELQEWADKKNLDIDFYEDIAISGQSSERESYEELMDRADEYDAVVVRELSRFGRSLRKVLNDIEELREKKETDFISLKENIDLSSAQGKLFFNMINAFNQFWADLNRERTEEMIERRKEEGKPVGRPKKLSEEQIREAVELYNEANLSYSDIARLFKQRYGFEKLHRSTIKRNLDNFEGGDMNANAAA